MNVRDAITARRSIRTFKSKPVEEEKLQRVLDAARLSPSARNVQDRRLIVVREHATREKLMHAAKNQTSLIQAPIVIAICGTITDYVMSCGQYAYTINAAIAVDHMTLLAVEEGLGTCWIGAFSEPEVKAILNIPDPVRVVALLPLGYAAEAPVARERKGIQEIVSYETY